MGYLDKDGLAHLWGKITDYVAQNSGGTVDWENVNGRPDLSSVSSMKVAQVALLAVGWASDNTQMVDVAGILTDENQQLIIPVPKAESKAVYINSGIECIAQAADSLTFQCASVPTEDIRINVFVFGAAEVGEEFVGELVWWSPQMTGENTPEPYVVTANGYQTGYYGGYPYQAFDGNVNTSWDRRDNSGSSKGWIVFDFGASRIVKGISITAHPDYVAFSPAMFDLEGSNNGEDWTVIQKFNNLPHTANTQRFELDGVARYRYFKLNNVDAEYGNGASYAIIAEIQFYILQQGGAS